MSSVRTRRLQFFSEVLSHDPHMDSKELIARLRKSYLFSKYLAISWDRRRAEFLQKSQQLKNVEPKGLHPPGRKFMTHVYEIGHLFLGFLPERQCLPKVSKRTYQNLKTLQVTHQLVTVYRIERNFITVRFPDAYDNILHSFFTGRRVCTETRFRFWSDFKFEVLNPVSSSNDKDYILRTFPLPEDFLHHGYLKGFLAGPMFQHIGLQIIGETLLQYLQNMVVGGNLRLLENFCSRRNKISHCSDYVTEYDQVIQSRLDDWNGVFNRLSEYT